MSDCVCVSHHTSFGSSICPPSVSTQASLVKYLWVWHLICIQCQLCSTSVSTFMVWRSMSIQLSIAHGMTAYGVLQLSIAMAISRYALALLSVRVGGRASSAYLMATSEVALRAMSGMVVCASLRGCINIVKVLLATVSATPSSLIVTIVSEWRVLKRVRMVRPCEPCLCLWLDPRCSIWSEMSTFWFCVLWMALWASVLFTNLYFTVLQIHQYVFFLWNIGWCILPGHVCLQSCPLALLCWTGIWLLYACSDALAGIFLNTNPLTLW
jgi:hypothetical protein